MATKSKGYSKVNGIKYAPKNVLKNMGAKASGGMKTPKASKCK